MTLEFNPPVPTVDPETLRVKSIKRAVAKKDYRCNVCYKKIKAGVEVDFVRTKLDDEMDLDNWKHHAQHPKCTDIYIINTTQHLDEFSHSTDVTGETEERHD